MTRAESKALTAFLSECAWTVASRQKRQGFESFAVLVEARSRSIPGFPVPGALAEESIRRRIGSILNRETIGVKDCFRYLKVTMNTPGLWKAVTWVSVADGQLAVNQRRFGVVRDDAKADRLDDAVQYMKTRGTTFQTAWEATG